MSEAIKMHAPPAKPSRIPLWRLGAFRRDLLNNLIRLRAKHGDLAPIRIGPFHVVLVTDPEWVKRILVTDHAVFEKSLGLKRMKVILGEGLLTSEGAFHRRQRQLIQPAFHRDPMRRYGADMIAAALRTRDAWRDGAEVDMMQEMMRLTLAIVAKTLFSANVEDEADSVGEALSTVLDGFPRLLAPWGTLAMKLIPSARNRKLKAARARLDKVIYDIIGERRASGECGGDLLGMLLAAGEEGMGGMTPTQVRDEAMTLFLAGHETTAVGLSWAWRLLAENPDARAKLDAELQAVLQGRAPAYDDLPQLAYTRKVFQEAMRLYPPAYAMGRRVMQPYRVGPYDLPPRRSLVFVSPYILHHDARYFPDPERFDPDRWTPAFEEALPKFAYFPFGGGPRVCIGANFAWMEGTLLLAVLAQQWRMELLPGQTITPRPLVTLRPHPAVRMRLERAGIR